MGKVIAILSLLLIGVPLLGMGIKLIFFPVNTAQKLIETGYEAQDKVLNADNAIYNYEWFKQKNEDIQASKNMLNNSRTQVINFEVSAGDRTTWTFEDKGEHARLNTVVLGLENHLEQQIADYNARAKMATRNIFEDNVLPSYIDALTFIKK